MAGPTPPPPGVSQITSSGARIAPLEDPVEQSSDPESLEKAARQKSRGRQIRPGEDVIKDLSRGRRTQYKSTATQGTRAIQQDIVEVPLPVTRKTARNRAIFQSIDGEEYTFRITLPNGKTDPDAYMKCLFAAVREMSLGGDPFVVFDAFKLSLPDEADKLLYPVSPEMMARALSRRDALEYYSEEEDEEGRSFSLGEDD